MSSSFGQIKLFSGSNTVNLRARAGLGASYDLVFPNTTPSEGQILRYDSVAGALVWGVATATTISSDETFLVVTPTGNDYAISFPNQTVRTFLSADATGDVGFRGIEDADLTSLDASKLTGTVAPARMPVGTEGSSWQLGVTALNPKITATGSATIEVRQNDNTLADIVVRKITASQVDYQQVTEINVGDNIFVLNSDVTGTPVEDAGLEIERGTETNAQILWIESVDRWQAGLVGSLRKLAYLIEGNFVAADLVGNILTVTHNLNTQDIHQAIVKNTSNQLINVDVTANTVNTVQLDLTGLSVTGTWRYLIDG